MPDKGWGEEEEEEKHYLFRDFGVPGKKHFLFRENFEIGAGGGVDGEEFSHGRRRRLKKSSLPSPLSVGRITLASPRLAPLPCKTRKHT